MPSELGFHALFDLFRHRFDVYAASFAEADGSFAVPIARKIEHTVDVCSITDELCSAPGTGFEPEAIFLFRVCALFHDVSRFEQFRDFHTFRDDASFDHGARSAALLLERDFIPELTPDQRNCVEGAIAAHNKLAIPPDLPEAWLPAAKMVRDADKLGILKLVLDFFTNPARAADRTMKLDLPDTPGFTASVAAAVLDGRPVPHRDMRCVNDFKITMFAWVNDLNYPAACVFALRENFYGRLRALLPAGPDMDALLDYVRMRLRAQAGGFAR